MAARNESTPTSCVEIAQELIRIPSVNPSYDPASNGERNVAAWLEKWGRSQGFEVFVEPVLNGRSNVILRLRNGSQAPHLLFNGHMDTVSVDSMSIPPFDGAISEGRLWGRGAADMKGPLACMLEAACHLRDQPQTWRGTLSVGCVVDEEYRYRGITELMKDNELPTLAIVGEPTSMQVIRGCKGCLRFVIRALGKSVHSSEPAQGRSAILAIAEAVILLEEFFGELAKAFEHPEFGTPTVSVGLIEGGEGINIVPSECSIDVDVRLLPSQNGGQLYRDIQEYVKCHATRVTGIEWTFEDPSIHDPGYELEADHPLVREACSAVGSSGPGVVQYGCDASKVAHGGVPCIILGPGQIAQAHTRDESIAVEELEGAVNGYVTLAKKLMPVSICRDPSFQPSDGNL